MDRYIRYLIFSNVSWIIAVIISIVFLVIILSCVRLLAVKVEAQTISCKNIILSGLSIFVVYIVLDLFQYGSIRHFGRAIVLVKYVMIVFVSAFITRYFLAANSLKDGVFISLPYILFYLSTSIMISSEYDIPY